MGTAMDNDIQDAVGVGLNCDDQSMCMFEHNVVVGTRDASAGGNGSARGFGVLASFYSEAYLWDNELSANPVPVGTVTSSLVRTSRSPGW
jgi:hypothetical protein